MDFLSSVAASEKIKLGYYFDIAQEHLSYLSDLLESKENAIEIIRSPERLTYWRNGSLLMEIPIEDVTPRLQIQIEAALLIGISLGKRIISEQNEFSDAQQSPVK